MPTSHGSEDDECVDGSAISLATVYVHVFRTSKKMKQLYLRTNTDWNLHAVMYMYSYFRVHCSIIGTHGTRASLALFLGSSRPSFC